MLSERIPPAPGSLINDHINATLFGESLPEPSRSRPERLKISLRRLL